MHLTIFTDYALRVLIHAALHPDRRITITEIANAYGISRNHLMKVVYELGVAGYLETIRGQNGGIRLAKAPQDIILGEVVRRTEPENGLMPCFDTSDRSCRLSPSCRLKRALQKANGAFFEVLDSYTLADITENGDALKTLLGEFLPSATG